MKELSIEEKAKAYDEAIEIARAKYAMKDQPTHQDLVDIFPELAELKNERIRKHLIGVVELYYGKTDEQGKKDCLAWLEKQAEHANFRSKIQIGDNVTRNKDGVLVNLSQLNRVAKKQCEQKPAEWSEEIEAAISLLKHIAEEQEKDYCPHNANALRKAAQYLESIRPQNTWKPSDEQIEALESATENCAYSEYQGCLRELIEQLKKLKE